MDNIIEVSGLVKRFTNFQLGPLDLKVPKGAIYGFIGANGAGKTTTMDLMMGMGFPDSGSIRIFNMDHDKDEVAIKLRTGYAGPEVRFDGWGKIGRLLSFWSHYYPTWDHAYCHDLMARFALKPTDKIPTLSTGNRTKLGLLTALSHRPELLLLDEPMIGLDAIAKQELFAELLGMMRDESRTVMISSHNLDDLERICDHVGILSQGRMLVEGNTTTLIERFAQVRVTANGFNPDSIAGVRRVTAAGPDLTLLVDRSTDASHQLTQHYGPQLAYVPVTLEELFIGLARES